MKFPTLLSNFTRYCLVFSTALLLAFTTPLQAADLELEGNIKKDATVDWQNIFSAVGDGVPTKISPLPTGYSEAVFVRDFVPGASGPDESTFTTGSKDTLDITPGWECTRSNNVNDKTDVVNAYATAATDANGDIIIYFAMERYSNEGTGNIGFWFLQDDNVGCTIDRGKSGSFTGNHVDGDILIVAEFTNGGAVTEILAYRWDGTTNTLDPTPYAAGGQCQNGGSGDNLCAIVNTSKLLAGSGVPWLTETKQPGNGASNDLDVSEFFEGRINLSKLGLLGCFSQYMAVTRSSNSLTATIFDYALGDFELCGIDVSKVCSNPRLNANQDMIIYDITGSVTNTGVGTVHNVEVTDAPKFSGAPAPYVFDPASGAISLGSIDAQKSAPYAGFMVVPLDENGRSDMVTASATTDAAGSNAVPDATATADCPKLVISPELSVSKECETSVSSDGSKVFAKVSFSGKVCNTGDSKLTDVSVVDNHAGTVLSGGELAVPADPDAPTVAEGACLEYSGDYIPTTATTMDENTTTTNPGEVVFSDTVKANGKDIFGDNVTEDTAMASCPLCPKCPEC